MYLPLGGRGRWGILGGEQPVGGPEQRLEIRRAALWFPSADNTARVPAVLSAVSVEGVPSPTKRAVPYAVQARKAALNLKGGPHLQVSPTCP